MPHAFSQNGHPFLINVKTLNQVEPSKKSWFLCNYIIKYLILFYSSFRFYVELLHATTIVGHDRFTITWVEKNTTNNYVNGVAIDMIKSGAFLQLL
jgi:hypothetical protein